MQNTHLDDANQPFIESSEHLDEHPHGITITSFKEKGRCLTVTPMSIDDFDVDWQRASHSSLLHAGMILLTFAFVFLQNTVSIHAVVKAYGKNPKTNSIISTSLVILCGAGTFVQTLAARALKIVAIPSHLTMSQQTLLSTLDRQLQKSKKSATLADDMLVLVSLTEFEAMKKPMFHGFYAEKKTDLHYQLQLLASSYQTQLHILAIDNENIPHVDLKKVPLQGNYNTLVYSPECNLNQLKAESLWPDNIAKKQETLTLPLSFIRYATDKPYFQSINHQKKHYALITLSAWNFLAFFLLAFGPFIANTLQGPSSLSDTLNDTFGVHQDNAKGPRMAILLFGLLIGFNKAYITYMTKSDVAIKRWDEIWSHETYKKVTAWLASWGDTSSDDTHILKIFSFDQTISGEERRLILNYQIISNFSLLLSSFIALGTIDYYGGLGLLFSGSGLIYTLETFHKFGFHNFVPKVNEYNVFWYAAFCIDNALSQALLNGVLNQGFDFIQKSLASKEKLKYTASEKIKQLRDESKRKFQAPAQSTLVPEAIKDMWKRNTYGKNALIFFTLLDSFSAAFTATAGSLKIQEAITAIAPAAKDYEKAIPLVIGFCILASQLNYSFVMYSRDGNLWGILGQIFLPKNIRSCIGLNAVKQPGTDAHVLGESCALFRNRKAEEYTESLKSTHTQENDLEGGETLPLILLAQAR